MIDRPAGCLKLKCTGVIAGSVWTNFEKMKCIRFLGLSAFFLFWNQLVLAVESPIAQLGEKHRSFFHSYCVDCHGPEKQKGKLRLDEISFVLDTVEKADRWQKILNQINSGEMPPPESKTPDRASKTDLLEALSETMVRARQVLGDAGRATVLRRLNRREYANTVRDLLGIDADVRALPDDSAATGSAEGEFDTFGSGLFLSSDQFEQYLEIGRRSAETVLAEWQRAFLPAPEKKIVRTEVEIAARRQIAGLLNGYFLGGYRKAKEWEAAGSDPNKAKEFGFPDHHEAKFRIRAYQEAGPYLGQYLALPKGDEGAWLMYSGSNMHDTEKIVIPADAPSGRYILRLLVGASDKAPISRRFMEMGVATDAESFQSLRLFHITGTVQRPQRIEFTVDINRGSNRVFTFREKRYGDRAADSFRQAYAKAVNGVGLDPALWVDWVEWEGPLKETQTPERWVRLFGRESPPSGEQTTEARRLLHNFSTRAFRGIEPEESFIDGLMELYSKQIENGKDPLYALVEPIAAALSAPGFLYLNAPRFSPSDSRLLSQFEIAARLSYFLWSSAPDEILLDAAKNHQLTNPSVLSEQVQRMISDSRSFAFASGFTHQWLDLDRLDFFQFNHQLYPEFDESTRAAARAEVYHTFFQILQANLDARLLLRSDFVVVNPLLSNFYGLPDCRSEEFQPMKLPDGSPRGGLLGMAAILAMGSDGERTSPVERGAWTLRKLLNTPPPPAPPNVPQLSRFGNKAMPARERLKAHQEEPQCAQCHRKIDPIGFGLENFDAAGRWRTEEPHYKNGWVIDKGPHGKVISTSFPIDASGTLHDGSAFNNFFQLRDLLAARGDDFLRGLIENIYAYALGRRVSFADADSLAHLCEVAKNHRGALSTIIEALVLSDEFQTRR